MEMELKTMYGGNSLPDPRDLSRASARMKRREREVVMNTVDKYGCVDEQEGYYLDDYDA